MSTGLMRLLRFAQDKLRERKSMCEFIPSPPKADEGSHRKDFLWDCLPAGRQASQKGYSPLRGQSPFSSQ